MRRDAELAEQAAEQRIVPRVVDEKSGVECEPVADDRVRVPAGAAVALEDVDLVRAREQVRGAQPRHAAADDGYLPRHQRAFARQPETVGPHPLVDANIGQIIDEPLTSADTRVGTVRPRTSTISQVVTLVAVIVPPLGLLSAMGLLWGVAFHWVDLALLAFLYVVCAFGTTIGFHRYFTHRGFEARAPVKARSAILGCMTMQGPITQWVTDHRKHHALSDQPGDPHSPHVGHGEGAWAPCAASSHAHVGWLFSNLGMEQGREYGKDLYEDRLVRAIDRAVPALGRADARDSVRDRLRGRRHLAAGLEALVWGGLIRIFLYQHATFSVNSICHMFGRQDYRSRDEARNNWLVALLVFGEGWHNNHHAFPASARHGLDRRQIDVSWWVIRGLETARARLEREGARRSPARAAPASERRELIRDESRPRAGARQRQARGRPATATRGRARAPGMSVYLPSTPIARARSKPRRDSVGETPGMPGQPAVERAVEDVEPLPAERRETEPLGDPRRQAEHALDGRLAADRDRDGAAHREAEQERPLGARLDGLARILDAPVERVHDLIR